MKIKFESELGCPKDAVDAVVGGLKGKRFVRLSLL